MTTLFRSWRLFGLAGLSALTLFGTLPMTSQAQTLSDNLSSPSGGTETASGTNWLTASFGTDASAYRLDNITLALAETTPGTAELDLYTDGGLQPGSLVGTLTSPSSYSSSLTNTTFTATGLTLDPNSTYWAVLKANSGAFDWSFANDDNSTGAGFTDTWGSSADAGVTWFTFTGFPTQMSVSATASPVPEPGAFAFMVIGGALTAGGWLRCSRSKITA